MLGINFRNILIFYIFLYPCHMYCILDGRGLCLRRFSQWMIRFSPLKSSYGHQSLKFNVLLSCFPYFWFAFVFKWINIKCHSLSCKGLLLWPNFAFGLWFFSGQYHDYLSVFWVNPNFDIQVYLQCVIINFVFTMGKNVDLVIRFFTSIFRARSLFPEKTWTSHPYSLLLNDGYGFARGTREGNEGQIELGQHMMFGCMLWPVGTRHSGI